MKRPPLWLVVAVALAIIAFLSWDRDRGLVREGALREQAKVTAREAARKDAAFDSVARRAIALADTASRLAKQVQRAQAEAKRTGDLLASVSHVALNVAADTSVGDSTLRLTIIAQSEAAEVHLAADVVRDALAQIERDSLRLAIRTLEASGRDALLAERRAGMAKLALAESRVPTLRDKARGVVVTVGVWEGGKALARAFARP